MDENLKVRVGVLDVEAEGIIGLEKCERNDCGMEEKFSFPTIGCLFAACEQCWRYVLHPSFEYAIAEQHLLRRYPSAVQKKLESMVAQNDPEPPSMCEQCGSAMLEVVDLGAEQQCSCLDCGYEWTVFGGA